MCVTIQDDFNSSSRDWRDVEKQRKSGKRKAAELKLARRASSSRLNDSHRERNDTTGDITDGSSSSLNTVCSIERDWTRTCMHVDVPAKLDWSSIFSDSRYFSRDSRNLDVMVVENEVAHGLMWLKQGMRDSVIAIDLEWRPDSKHTNNNVACIQLATKSRCLLVRCCHWSVHGTLPTVLVDFFSDPGNLFVSFSWDRGDERKMCSTFGVGKRLFWNFIDIQKIAVTLGYPDGCGLSVLSRFVLGASLPKSKFVSRSDWQRHVLSTGQIRYAALDAFVTGEIYRTFRLWSESPKVCQSCKTEHGIRWYPSKEVRGACVCVCV